MATAAAGEAALRKAPFRIGGKKVFLPNHVITFVRPKPRQPANLATFIVPLQFNKLDFRDYLYNVYNVEVRAVRSFINGQAPRQKHDGTGPWYRPRSKKMMTVELLKPFVWPEVPEDLKGWDKEMHEAQQKARTQSWRVREKFQGGHPYLLEQLDELDESGALAREALKKQAEELRAGERVWTTDAVLDEKWTEVETDIDLADSAEPKSEGESTKST
ncbi:hypothetical protein NKR23_g8243 [Pleurostoma richardsiae]|uniref:Large ribosomal subunit protein uL23m n=1 Tax=Pleurostoma richardsiae TaxID=41990 RepID=A0AA38RRF8_9PEZI|nr:hypothetical protein NKR23_g8243 [Pleurostoma richardsiae]